MREDGREMSRRNRNLVIIGGELWGDKMRRSETSFCVHIEQELRRAGKDIEVVALEHMDLGICDGRMFLRLPNGEVFHRGDAGLPIWALCYVVPARVVFMLEQMGIACFSSSAMISLVEDKMRTHVLFEEVFRHPDTLFYGSEKTSDKIFRKESEAYPFMLKGASGRGGENVEKIFSLDDACDFIDDKGDILDLIMIQQAMPTADDLRVYCLGDEIVGAVLRQAPEGVWKANLEFSPRRSPYELSREEKNAVYKAMKMLPQGRRGLYSFDFLFNDAHELVFCEANCNVGTNALDAVRAGREIFLRYVAYIRREMQREQANRTA